VPPSRALPSNLAAAIVTGTCSTPLKPTYMSPPPSAPPPPPWPAAPRPLCQHTSTAAGRGACWECACSPVRCDPQVVRLMTASSTQRRHLDEIQGNLPARLPSRPSTYAPAASAAADEPTSTHPSSAPSTSQPGTVQGNCSRRGAVGCRVAGWLTAVCLRGNCTPGGRLVVSDGWLVAAWWSCWGSAWWLCWVTGSRLPWLVAWGLSSGCPTACWLPVMPPAHRFSRVDGLQCAPRVTAEQRPAVHIALTTPVGSTWSAADMDEHWRQRSSQLRCVGCLGDQEPSGHWSIGTLGADSSRSLRSCLHHWEHASSVLRLCSWPHVARQRGRWVRSYERLISRVPRVCRVHASVALLRAHCLMLAAPSSRAGPDPAVPASAAASCP
jgi:hypothetical protein